MLKNAHFSHIFRHFWPKKFFLAKMPMPYLKEISVPAEKAYSDYLYSRGCKIITKKESIGQLKGVKSIFESVINAHSKINTPKHILKCSVIKNACLFLSQKQYIFSNKKNRY